MEWITISEMAEKTGMNPKTIHTRLRTLGIKPITREAIYPASALEALEEMRPVGRPTKAKPDPEPVPEKPAAKPKKAKK